MTHPKPEARLTLPLPTGSLETVMTTMKQQVATVMAAPDYVNQPKIQDAAKATLADLTTLDTTLTSLSTTHALLGALVLNKTQQAFSVRMNHDGLETAINLAYKGAKASLVPYGGTIVEGRNVVPTSLDAPVNASLKSTKVSGEARARCQPDDKAFAYAFQFGTDPANPDAWPKPIMEGKASHLATGLPVAQKIYCRISIYRRGAGQGQWSDVLSLLVR